MRKTWKKVQRAGKTWLKKASSVLRKYPLRTVFVLLGLLALSIWIGVVLREPEIETTQREPLPQLVQVYGVGEQPSIVTTAEVRKTGIVEVVAQSSGVVQDLRVVLGQEVAAGQTLLRLSTNYQGGSVPGVQRAIAQEQYESAQRTRELQQAAIAVQRQIATNSAQNTQEQREIQVAALEDTRNLLELNELMLSTVDDSLAGATASADIQVLRQQKAQLLSAVNQLRSSVRTLEYLEDETNPPTQLQRLQQDVTIKQLEIQEQGLKLNEDVALLQLQLARIQESLLFPAAPFTATVERIHVAKGQAVSPGQVLVTLNCDQLVTDLIARVTPDVAARISRIEPTKVFAGDSVLSLFPQYVSSVATDGQLHTVVYHLPEGESSSFTNTAHARVQLPLSAGHARMNTPFIPIDAVYQTETSTTVQVISDSGTVETREIRIGAVTGRYVAVLEGLSAPTQVILDRTVVAGQPVTVE